MKTAQHKAVIAASGRLTGNYYKLVLKDPAVAACAVAGQFVMLKVTQGVEPLLRRPFSIHGVTGPKVEILYEVLGKGTQMLSRSKPGERVDVIGPLGEGFDTKPPACRPTSIIVAGGIGVAPLRFLAEKFAGRKTRRGKREILVLIGARTQAQILCEKEFKKLGCDVTIATDDGSRGYRGRVTGLLEEQLQTIDPQGTKIYACGPTPMLREISRISREYTIPAQVSLEAHMACGIGVCLGCVVRTKGGYKRVCKEGPVFEADTLIY